MTAHENLAAIIVAAGASRRLGEPKQLIQIEGETLLGRTFRNVREADIDSVFVVLGAHREGILEKIDLTDAQIVINHDWEQGIASSIRAGMLALQRDRATVEAVLLLVCDQPNLSAQHVRALIDAHERTRSAIVASRYEGLTGIPAIFPADQFSSLIALQGDEGARRLLRNADCSAVAIDFEGGEVDIDTQGDVGKISSLEADVDAFGLEPPRFVDLRIQGKIFPS